jgi:hypothetical protein
MPKITKINCEDNFKWYNIFLIEMLEREERMK